MSESENHNLDNFFKRRAHQTNVQFSEQDWQQLEARLDKEMPLKPGFVFWLRKYWFVPAVLGIATAVLLFVPKKAEDQLAVRNNPVGQQTSGGTNAETENASPRGESELTNPTVDLPIQRLPEKLDEQVSVKVQAEKSAKNPADVPQNADIHNRVKSDINQPDNKTGYVVLENGDETLRLSSVSLPRFLSPVFPEGPDNPELLRSLQPTDISPENKQRFRKQLIVGIGYGADFSAVGLDNFTSPGSRWKVDLEYALSSRFSISTGVVLVNNLYNAYGDEYKAPERYWRNGPVADEVYGECNMIDIPLNLRYNYIAGIRHRAFISAGLSTYFLTKEDYYFDYDSYAPDAPDHWGTDKTSVYPFSIVNVSLGYEYLFAGRGSLQVEPYLKIPLGEVGWGNVDLYTLGIYFSYRYRLLPK